MGDRIHKCIGYGFEHNADNPLSFNVEKWCVAMEDPKKCDLHNFLAYFEKVAPTFKREAGMMHFPHFTSENSLEKSLQLNLALMEQGAGHKLAKCCFVPFTFQRYSRYDDLIDYSECPDGIDRMQELPYGIYPYHGQWMKKRSNGEYTYIGFSRVCNDIVTDILADKLEYDALYHDLKELGLKSVEEWKEQYIPYIPEEIVALCMYLELFDNKEDIYKLRPCVMTYWR